MIPFPFNKKQFSFFVADHLLVGQLCTNPKSDRSLLSCLKVTQCYTSIIGAWLEMCRCTTLSTNPTYDNRTIASTLKMQIRTVQHAQGDENKVSGYGYGLWCGFKRGPHHATSHLQSQLESQHQSVPGCAEECGDPLVQSGGRWQTLGVAAGLGASPQVQRDPGLASEGLLWLCTLLSLAPILSLTWTCWTTSFGHSSRTSPTWPPTAPKLAWSLPSVEYSPRCCRRLWKRHAPSSGSVSRQWLRLKVATLNRCQLYYIIKLAELIFSIKVLK